MSCGLDFWYFARILFFPLVLGLNLGIYAKCMLGPWFPKWTGVKYRIQNINITRYRVQQWVWFFPFWVTSSSYNSFASQSEAREWMEDWALNGKNKTVETFKP